MHCCPQVSARTFYHFLGSGRTSPALFNCVDEHGAAADYVVKFQGRLSSGVVSELISCALGELLGIPVAAGAVVSIDERLRALAPALAEALDAGDGPHFGSKHHAGGFAVFNSKSSVPRALAPTAIDIFAWDMLLQNADRRWDNPNLLFDGSQFLVFDHELACAFDALIGGSDPFALHGTPLEKNHVLRFALVGHIEPRSFDSFAGRLADLSIGQIEELIEALPGGWYYPRRTDAIRAHFAAVLADVDKFKRSLLGIFS